AAGDVGLSDRIGVGDQRPYAVDADTQNLRRDHRHRSPRSADVHRARYHAGAAVAANVDRGRGLMAGVEPEAKGHAAPAIGAGQFALVMFGVLERLADFDETNLAVL